MDRYIARENIDRFIELLNDYSLPPGQRAVITKLLIAEEDKLARNLEQLEFAESRAARGRVQLNRMRQQLAECHPDGRAQLERLVQNCEALQDMLDDFCHGMRNNVNSAHNISNLRPLG